MARRTDVNGWTARYGPHMTISYRDFAGSGAENYERYFVPAVARPVSAGLLDVACGTGLVARAPEEACTAMEAQAVAAWQPYVEDGRIQAEQSMLIATGWR
jgi:hypothetical protein